MKPSVSVVIPAYNCAGTIGIAVDSALAQDAVLEVIVINDRSPEDLSAVMAKYADEPRVVYLVNEENIGAAQTRNKAVGIAKGEYVAFLDSDDYWTDGKLRAQLAAIEKSGAVLCCTARELMKPDGTLTGRVLPVREKITYRALLKHNSIACSSVLLKTRIAREFPMEHEESHEDYILWLKILQKYGFACGVNEPMLKYRVSNTSKSGSKLQSAKMTFSVYRIMGFGWFKSVCCFISYALNGVWKHFIRR